MNWANSPSPPCIPCILIMQPYRACLCVKSDLCYSFLHSCGKHKTDRHFRLPLSLSGVSFFAGELKLIVSNVAIQLWSRAVLQGCHDRINENNIRESQFIHMLLGKGQRPYFKGKCQHSRASQQQMVWERVKMKPELTSELFVELKKKEISK